MENELLLEAQGFVRLLLTEYTSIYTSHITYTYTTLDKYIGICVRVSKMGGMRMRNIGGRRRQVKIDRIEMEYRRF